MSDFRAEVKAWLEDNCPQSMRTPYKSEKDICWGGRHWVFQSDDQKLWLERMGEKGWTTPAWPKEYGGGGLDREQVKILKQEMANINARSPLESFGIWMLGPALLKYGSEEQKLHYLPKIIKGEIRWCQGYSEPGAGSDLASLQTSCIDKGDHYLVNGQKVWTSYADEADWIFCLVRTDPKAKKHEGISFILFDMESKGVSTKPIALISGSSPFCETFFDDVKVPKENLMGELNKGWTIAKYLLTHEREMIAGSGLSRSGQTSISDIAKKQVGLENGRLSDPLLRAQIARQEVNEGAFMLTLERVKEEAKAGQGVGATSAMLKYYGTELNKSRNEILMSIGGTQALSWEGASSNDGQVAKSWLRTRANSIEGGTSEVQLNIISKRILGLPS